jgi:hypothetical protein
MTELNNSTLKEYAKDNLNKTPKIWIPCSICKSTIHIQYLDQHIKTHVYTAKPKNVSSASQVSSSAIVRVEDKTNITTYNSNTSKDQTWSSMIKSSIKEKPSIHTPEKYKFRELNHVCAAGSSSKSGRYSDFTIVFWTNECISVQNSSYYGNGYSSYVSKDWERLSIHTVYDSLEDYYTVSCKLSRRAVSGSWDTDDCVPDRICFQHELMTEIKRALLFFRVSPKAAYKLFRKLFNEELSIQHDEKDGSVLFVHTKSYDELSSKLKSSFSNYNPNHKMYDGEGYHGY